MLQTKASNGLTSRLKVRYIVYYDMVGLPGTSVVL
jgi:hypothetical protein